MLSTRSLGTFIGTEEEREIIEAISNFSCKDKDVEFFLKNKAIEFERRNKFSEGDIITEESQFL